MRWSMRIYLQRWFEVSATDSANAARQFLAERAVGALVVSDETTQEAADLLEQHAHRRNPDVITIRTVTDSQGVADGSHAVRLEKPFDLSRLADLLGVSAADIGV